MSGRIYDSGINPVCDKCGSKMYTSAQTNFYGAQCKRKGCDGNPIYADCESATEKVKKPHIFHQFWRFLRHKQKYKNGYILEGIFSDFDMYRKRKYSIFERLRNTIYTITHDKLKIK